MICRTVSKLKKNMNSEARIIERDLELRHLPKQVVSKLGNILQVDHSWKDIMCLIPDYPWVPGQDFPSEYFSQKYSSEQIRCANYLFFSLF